MAKKLFRIQGDKMIGGVCSGLAEYLELDVTLIRLICVAIALVTAVFPMLIFYLAAWIIIPVKEEVVVLRKKEKAANNKSKGTD